MRLFLISLIFSVSAFSADIFELVELLDKNDTTSFKSKIITADDASTNREDNHKSILMYAVWLGNYEAVEHLIATGAEINATDNGGATALHLAIWKNNIDIATLLVKNGAASDILSSDGMSATDIAILQQNKEMMELLNSSKKERKKLF